MTTTAQTQPAAEPNFSPTDQPPTAPAIDREALKSAVKELFQSEPNLIKQWAEEAKKAKKTPLKKTARPTAKLQTMEEIQAYLSRNKASEAKKAEYSEKYTMNLDALRELQAFAKEHPELDFSPIEK